MTAYKVVSEVGGDYVSVVAPENLKVRYKVGQKVEGIDGTPLFVFRTLKRAEDFRKSNAHKNATIWECKVGRLPGKRPKHVLPIIRATIEDVKRFWKNQEGREFWMMMPGTILARWVELIRRVE